MAKIFDPDSLTRSTTLSNVGVDGNIWIDTGTKKIKLATFGSLSTDGVTIQSLYSYLKEEWKTDSALIKYPFPMIAITPEQFEFVDGWAPSDIGTSNLFRDGGYAIKNSDGSSAEEYIGVITLGTLGGTDQVYYQQVLDGYATNVSLTGAVNQCVKVYGNISSNTISFSHSNDTIYSSVPITTFVPGDEIVISGSTSNDGTYYVYSIAPNKLSMVTEETGLFTDEAAGANISITADVRSYFKIFVREYQKLYAQSEQSDIGVSEFTYQAYRFPLANGVDLKITHDDTSVSTNAPYTGMTINYLLGENFYNTNVGTVSVDDVIKDGAGRWYICTGSGTIDATDYANLSEMGGAGTAIFITYPGERQIGNAYYAFDIIIDAGTAGEASVEQVYEFIQYSLRQDNSVNINSNINTDGVVGKTANSLIRFVGDTLITSSGVFIDDFSLVDINRIDFYDVSGIKRIFPFVAAGYIYFNDIFVLDGDGVYRMFFTDANGNNFGDADAIIVKDKDNADISGNITGSQVSFTFDYDGNVQGGRTPSTDAPVTIVGIGLTKAQYVKTTGTIGRTNANSFSLVASLERNFLNPA